MGLLILGMAVGLFFVLTWSFAIWCVIRFFYFTSNTSLLLFIGYALGFLLTSEILKELDKPSITTVAEFTFLLVACVATVLNYLYDWGVNKVSRKFDHD